MHFFVFSAHAQIAFLGNRLHKNVLKLLHYCMEEGYYIIIYEFMEKGSLRKLLLAQKRGKIQ